MLNAVPLKEIRIPQSTDVCFITCPRCNERTDFLYGEADVINHVWKICVGCGTILFVDLNEGSKTQSRNPIFNGGCA